jgi:hypothetical protein
LAFLSSAVARSVIVAEIVLPGKNVAPPEATKIEPLKTTGPLSKSTEKFVTPIRRSANSRMPPKESAGVPAVEDSPFGAFGLMLRP